MKAEKAIQPKTIPLDIPTSASDERPYEVLMSENKREDSGLLNRIGRYAEVRRLDTHHGRCYAILGAYIKEPQLFRGLTSFISLIPDESLDDVKKYFMLKYGQNWEYELNDLADLGTFGHYKIGELASIGRVYTGIPFELELSKYMSDKGVSLRKLKHWYNLTSAWVFSINCFLDDYEVEVFAVEYPVFDPITKLATCDDFIVEMNESKDSKRRINAVINLKCREKAAVYHKDAVQTNIEMFMTQRLIDEGLISLPNGHGIHDCFVLCPKVITARTRDNFLLKKTTGLYTEEQYKLDYQYFKSKGLLDMNIDKEYPQYQSMIIERGVPPRYETIRERMNFLFNF